MLEKLDLGNLATFLDRDLVEDDTLKKLRRVAAGYAFGKTIYRNGKTVRVKWNEHKQSQVSDDRFTITVEESDDAYYPLYAWMMSNRVDVDEHDITVLTSRSGNDDDFDSFNPSNFDVEFSCVGDYNRHVKIGDYDVDITHVIGKYAIPTTENVRNVYGAHKEPDEIVITALTDEAVSAVRAFLTKLVLDMRMTQSRRQRTSYLYMARNGRWGNSGNVRLRPLDTVIIKAGQIEPIVNDLEKFIASEQAYIRRSIPWHRGYLFHGPPGTGKTSLAIGLASHFRLNLYYIPLGDLDKDSSLIDLIGNVNERSILLFEDVDVFAAATHRDAEKGSASMSALLNSLDGAMTPHGLITIMTTNNLDALDDALVRPGRVDRLEEFGNVDEDQATRLFGNFYPDGDAETASRVGRACNGMAPAEVLEVCKRHLEEPGLAADELCGAKVPPPVRKARKKVSDG